MTRPTPLAQLALLALVPLGALPTTARAIVLTEVPTSITGVFVGDIEWGDFDGDGDLDVITMGRETFSFGNTTIYRNDGGSFVDINANIPNMYWGDSDWGDFDGDGDLDLALTGIAFDESDRYANIYRNDQGAFTLHVAFEGQFTGKVKFHDTDADGDLDLFVTGTKYSRTYINDGGNYFDWIDERNHGLTDGDVSFIDVDGDGHPDATFMGRIANSPTNNGDFITDIEYRTLGKASSITSLPGLDRSALDWGDVNGDGDLDLVTSGQIVGGINQSNLYRQDAGAFTPQLMSSISRGDAAWGDADNDGDLDLVYSGWDSLSDRKIILKRNDNGILVHQGELIGLLSSSLAWGDYDGDGDLDLAAVGQDDTSFARFLLYRNDAFLLNTAPTVPTGLSVQSDAEWIELSWNPSTDLETADASLSYNVRVGSSPGANDIVPSHSLADGTRLLTGMGNTTLATKMFLDARAVPEGTFYWSVQAIDAGGGASPFAAEQQFLLPMSRIVDETVVGSWLFGDAAMVDMSGDGVPEIMMSGADSTSSGTRIFSPGFLGSLTLNESGGMAWGDYDRDGFVDLVLSNGDDTVLFRNDRGEPSGTNNLGLPMTGGGGVEWGDYDNDGDLDLMFVIHGLYRNDGSAFVHDPAIQPGSSAGYARFGDYDRDGDLDLLQGGRFGASDFEHRVQRNDNGSWTEIFIATSGDYKAAGCFVDYDGDADLDVVVTSEAMPAEIHRNDGGTFTLDSTASAGLPWVSRGAILPADFDHDGDQDLLLTGLMQSNAATPILENIGGTFAFAATNLPHMEGTGSWGDYDGDNDLDILLLGIRESGVYGGGLYRNNTTTPNQPPQAPTNLGTGVQDGYLYLYWTAGSDAETSPFEVTHNVRVGTAPGLGDVVPPMALADGTRQVFRPGNAQWSPIFKLDLTNIVVSPLYWTVQTVDGSYIGSAFAPEQSVALAPTGLETEAPSVASLRAVAPNPTSGRTVASLTMPRAGQAAVKVYDVRGRAVRTLHDGRLPVGTHELTWDTRDAQGQPVASGAYFLRMVTQGTIQTRKVTVTR